VVSLEPNGTIQSRLGCVLIGVQLSLASLGCEPGHQLAPVWATDSESPAKSSDRTFRGHKTSWEAATWSPQAVTEPTQWPALEEKCGRTDAALAKVARQVLAEPGFGLDINDVDRVGFALRAAGAPYVWPRAWSLVVPNTADMQTLVAQRFDAWMGTFNDGGERRCGFAIASTAEASKLAVLAVDALADMVQPLPTQARTGQWVELRVRLLAPATDAKVLLQGPTGEPVFVPATLNDGEVRSRFPLASPGQWLIQVMATMQTGPRPVAEANVFVDQTPPKQPSSMPAPGESAKGLGSDPGNALLLMLNQARIEEGRKPLLRSGQLDELALEHTRAMLRAGHIGHDLGDGSPKQRMESAGIFASLAGENVVHAADAQRAHRALWASPSHRSNILHRGFRNVGIGALVGPDRTVWACELFAALD
jgi:uncharacterized protein YkwD